MLLFSLSDVDTVFVNVIFLWCDIFCAFNASLFFIVQNDSLMSVRRIPVDRSAATTMLENKSNDGFVRVWNIKIRTMT